MKTLLVLLAAFAASAALNAAEVVLRYAPSQSAEKASVAIAADALSAAVPAPDAEAGWRMLKHRALYTGYSPEANVQKDLTLAPRAGIYAAPREDAQVLGLVPEKAQVAVSQVADGWATVRFTTALPLYFYDETLAAPAEAAPEAHVPEAAPAEAAAPEAAPAAAAEAASGKAASPANGEQAHFYTGTMRSAGKFLVSFSKENFKYRLVSPDGKTAALLDFKDAVSSVPFTEYLNQPVHVLGTPEYVDYAPNCVIHVKMIGRAQKVLP